MKKNKPKNILIGVLFILAGMGVIFYNFYPLITGREGYISIGVIPLTGILLIIVGLWRLGLKLDLPQIYR
ncbi:MAG: hypothetical protein HYW23_00605 [Candidatus Aenigmarchaeota archaeon]|nr:hypothetical protein [Candidatus Aenigmarchaeota archaeon]